MRIVLSKIINRLFLPIISDRHLLPFRYFISVARNDCEMELRNLQQVINADSGIAIDIGANEGLYSYKLSKMFREVHSFEVNSTLIQGLLAYGGNVKVYNKGLSDVEGGATLYTPIVKGQKLTGWSSFSKDNCPDAEELIATDVDIATLDSFNISNVSFIKIDVEGHEIHVLHGAIETIRRDRPQVLLEVKEANEDKVFSFFEVLQYRKCRLEDLIDGVEGGKENYFFFPDKN